MAFSSLSVVANALRLRRFQSAHAATPVAAPALRQQPTEVA
jgi:hypothetical protein